MKLQTGYLYHIKDEFFDRVNDKELMINHENGHSRPSYLAIKDGKILWFIPLSTKVDKYQKEIDKKKKKHGRCKSILIKEIAGVREAILLQNAFPTIKKYVKSMHMIDGREIKVSSAVEREIISCFKFMIIMKEKGNNLFFTDIDKIKDIMMEELK